MDVVIHCTNSILCVGNQFYALIDVTMTLFRFYRFIFSNAPVNINDANIMNMLYQYAALYAQNKPILLDIWFFDSLPKNLDIFANICSKHNLLDLYLWLSFRFPNHFIERDLCLKRKEFAINIIESTLSKSKLQQSRNSSSHVVTYKKNREKILLKNNNYLPVLFGDNKEIYQSTKKYLSLMDKDKLFVYPTEENTNENPSKEENNWKKQKRNENKDTKKKGKRALNKVTQKNDEVIADLVATMTSTN